MNDEQTYFIASVATVLSLCLPLIVLFYVQNYDEVNNFFLFHGHEKKLIENYQTIVGDMERRKKKND